MLDGMNVRAISLGKPESDRVYIRDRWSHVHLWGKVTRT